MSLRALLCAGLLASASSSHAFSPAARPVLRDGLTHLFELDFKAARKRFRGLIVVEPEDPAGYLFEAAAIWWQGASEPVYGRVDDDLAALFHHDLDKTLKLAKKRARVKDERVRNDADFAAGMAMGLRGLWYWERGKRPRAKRYGRKAVRRLRKLVERDPKYYDAYFGIGLYNHLTGNPEGLYELRSAFKSGRWTSEAAGFFVLKIRILEEGDYRRGLKILRKMRKRFPQSPVFHLLEVVAFYRLGRWRDSWREARKLFAAAGRRPQLLGPLHPRVLCGFYTDRCLARETAVGVAEWTSRALQTRGSGGALRSLLRLYRAFAYDLSGERDFAKRDYKKVKRYRETARLLFARDRCRIGRCGRGDFVELLAELSGFADQRGDR